MHSGHVPALRTGALPRPCTVITPRSQCFPPGPEPGGAEGPTVGQAKSLFELDLAHRPYFADRWCKLMDAAGTMQMVTSEVPAMGCWWPHTAITMTPLWTWDGGCGAVSPGRKSRSLLVEIIVCVRYSSTRVPFLSVLLPWVKQASAPGAGLAKSLYLMWLFLFALFSGRRCCCGCCCCVQV